MRSMVLEPIPGTEESVVEILSKIDSRLAYIEKTLAHYEPMIAEAAARLAKPFWQKGR